MAAIFEPRPKALVLDTSGPDVRYSSSLCHLLHQPGTKPNRKDETLISCCPALSHQTWSGNWKVKMPFRRLFYIFYFFLFPAGNLFPVIVITSLKIHTARRARLSPLCEVFGVWDVSDAGIDSGDTKRLSCQENVQTARFILFLFIIFQLYI